MDYRLEPNDPKIIAYDWQDKEIYSHEDYLDFYNGYKVRNDRYEIIEFANTHMAKELKEITEDYLFPPTNDDELVKELLDYAIFIEGGS